MVNLGTPGSTNTSLLMKKSGLKSPPSHLKERQLDLMTDDLRRSIERLDKVIGKSSQKSNIKKNIAANRYSLEPHKAKVKRQSEVLKNPQDAYLLRRDINFSSQQVP
jgi:hypothetical protein